MNNTQYIAALKRELKGMGRQSRKEIIQEIQSHIEELGNTDSLLERFGPPEDLARQYLEGEPPRLGLHNILKRIGKLLKRIGKGYLIAIGIIVTAPIVIIAIIMVVFPAAHQKVGIVSTLVGDKFDYANESAPELSREWMSAQWNQPIRIGVFQGKMVIYWHDDKRVKWSCEGKGLQLLTGQGFGQGFIQQRGGFCIVFLPPSASTITSLQGGVVLVRPQASTKVEITQGNLRIADNGASYRYNIDADASSMAEFTSLDTSNIDIDIVAKQATVEAYVYDPEMTWSSGNMSFSVGSHGIGDGQEAQMSR